MSSKAARFINMIYGEANYPSPFVLVMVAPRFLRSSRGLFRLVSNRSILVLPNHETIRSKGDLVRNGTGYRGRFGALCNGTRAGSRRGFGPFSQRARVKSCREILYRLTDRNCS